MTRKLALLLLLAVSLTAGCAGPSKLAQRSDDRLAQGQMWQAWQLATRALDKAPANAEARASAGRAAAAIADDWQRLIRALAPLDSMGAAEQALEFIVFRAGAVRYTTVQVDDAWVRDERALLQGAARSHYRDGAVAMRSQRPKSAYRHFMQAGRFWHDYRDATARAAAALEQATTRVAIVPLRAGSGPSSLGRDVAASWRGDVVERLTPGDYFSRIVPGEEIERALRVSELGHVSRDQALRLGRKAGADRVVWGSIGNVESKSGFHLFTDRVARKIIEKDAEGRRTVRWVEVPIEVIARTRTVVVELEYEVVSTKDGLTLARHRGPQSMKARVVWTNHAPEGSPDSYALVSEQTRSSDPGRVKEIESRWSAVVGEGTTLAQVLEARRSSSSRSSERREVLGRIMAGAAFVFLEELPSTEELAFGALAGGWKPLCDDLVRLDGVDDVDLGVTTASADERRRALIGFPSSAVSRRPRSTGGGAATFGRATEREGPRSGIRLACASRGDAPSIRPALGGDLLCQIGRAAASSGTRLPRSSGRFHPRVRTTPDSGRRRLGAIGSRSWPSSPNRIARLEWPRCSC